MLHHNKTLWLPKESSPSRGLVTGLAKSIEVNARMKNINIMTHTRKGFTIVELLIVIVVIGILAAITIVAYNGIQARGRDSKRVSDLTSIKKALELYHVDKGGYPLCYSNATYTPGGTTEGCLTSASGLTAALVPAYLSSIPTAPSGSSYCGNYFYAMGYKKTSEVASTGNLTDNYMIGTVLESKTSPTGIDWGCPITYLDGSSN